MFGKLVNGIVESMVDRWLRSEDAKRYATSAVMRGLSGLMLILLARYGLKYGINDATAKVLLGHWDAIVTIVGPILGMVLVELASKYRAKVTAKTVEVAMASPSNTLTPQMAKEVAKVSLAQKVG
jgi:hypothetical protein